MNSKPQFKIHGKARREKKHELAELKSFVKNFWFCEYLCRDYGGGMPDKECEETLETANYNINILQQQLNEPYTD